MKILFITKYTNQGRLQENKFRKQKPKNGKARAQKYCPWEQAE